MIEFLTKPVHPDVLLDAIRSGFTRDLEQRERIAELAMLRRRLALLTPREREVLPLVVAGMLNKQAAASLGITEVMLQVHRGQIMKEDGSEVIRRLSAHGGQARCSPTRPDRANLSEAAGQHTTVREHFEILVVGSGEAGKYLPWTLASAGHRTALVEKLLIGGSCPNTACLPSKNLIHSAKVAAFARRAQEFGLEGTPLETNMKAVFRRKREMVEGLVRLHLDRFEASGVDLIMGRARFTGKRELEVHLNAGGSRVLTADRLFLNLGTRASLPDVRGAAAARPMTQIEALNLDRLPAHLIVLGGGYVGLELSQAMRRFGAELTVIQKGPQLAAPEDPDVGVGLLELFRDEGVQVLLDAKVRQVTGLSGDRVQVTLEDASGLRVLEGTDLLVATGRVPNTVSVGMENLGVQLDGRGYISVNERLETTAPNPTISEGLVFLLANVPPRPIQPSTEAKEVAAQSV